MPINRIRSQTREVKPLPRRETPDAAFSLRPKLLALREKLILALRQRHQLLRADAATLFYFHAPRQADYEAACESRATPDPAGSTLATEITDRIRAVWPSLVADADVRHAARALDGLHSSAMALAAILPAARDLADLLHVIDDEVLCVIEPASREGFTLEVRGVAEVNQLHDLLASLEPRLLHEEAFDISSRPQFQAFAISGLRHDGSLPEGASGASHWLFNEQPASAIARFEGERVVLMGDAMPTVARAANARFPDLMAEGQVIRRFRLEEVEARLSLWLGQPLAAPPLLALRAA